MAFLRVKDVLSYENLVHAISGATGGAFALSVFYPLDTLRTRLQVDQDQEAKASHTALVELLIEEGIAGVYRGWLPVIITQSCSSFVYFYVFSYLKMLRSERSATASVGSDLFLAWIAAIVNVLLTNPLWVASMRLKLQGAKLKAQELKDHQRPLYSGMIDCLVNMRRREGVWALWGGTVPSLVLTSNPAVQFMVYEALKRYCTHLFRAKELSGLTYFVCGAVAKSAATLATYPVQLVQSRLRLSEGRSRTERRTLRQELVAVIRTAGVWGLFKGLEAKLLQTVLTAALMFVCYEKIAAAVFRVMGLEPAVSSAR